MKRLLFVLMAVLMVAALPCYAANKTATFGDMNSSDEYRMTADTDGVITFASDTGIVLPYDTATTGETLTAAKSGVTMVSSATVAGAKFILPTATVGLSIRLVAGTAYTIDAKPQSTDKINYSTAVTGNKIVSAGGLADSVELFCATAGQWEIASMKGTWVVSLNP
jgi:hypothetical protein